MKWYTNSGKDYDVVLSTRVRLARNLREYPFPVRLDAKAKERVCNKVSDVLLKNEENLHLLRLSDLSSYEVVSLAEKHLISPEFASNTAGRALILSDEEDISIMLCEEDHVRLQVIYPGLSLEEAYKEASAFDEKIENSFEVAFDEKLGYLTQCPTNLGTGMRASVMLHLPALSKTGAISRLRLTVSKLGLTLRGSYGEGSEPMGDIYQLSNQVTLGISDEAAIKNLQSITQQIVEKEKKLRSELLENESVKDKIYRAYGILKSAYMLSSSELTSLISLARFGAQGGLLDIPPEKLTELLITMQPATLNVSQGRVMSSSERDALRAEIVRKELA